MTKIVAPWLEGDATQQVCAMLERAGKQALFVGGCVRNALLDAPVSDIDISTDARPEQVMDLARAAGLRAVPTGIDHGTVTVVAAHEPHEVTTFRRDVETDGRRAVIAYSDRIEDDAARRDFTVNAIYARSDGTVIDPLNGMRDLRARRIRFIGDPVERIHEDYLRSLRFFRFHAWYGDAAAGMDPDALAAIAGHLEGLGMLSRERVGAETLKLLGAPDPAPAVAAMRSTGALMHLLPGADDRGLAPLVHLEDGLFPDPLRRLAILGDADLMATMRLSRAQLQTVTELRNAALGTESGGAIGFRLGAERGRDALLLRAALLEQPLSTGDLGSVETGAKAKFPISARDLIPDYQGPQIGNRLKALQNTWIASDFQLSKDELLSLPDDFEG